MARMRVVQVAHVKAPLELVEREIPEPGAGAVRIKVEACGICHSDSLTKEGTWPGIQYPRSRDMRSPESSTRSATASPDGQPANGSESAGTADTAGTAIPAAAATSLPARSRPQCPASRTTAATPNT